MTSAAAQSEELVREMMRLRDGLRVERLDDEALVFDRSGEIIHRVTGNAVEALTLIQDGATSSSIPDHLVDAVDSLIRAQLVEDSGTISRRKLLLAGGAAWATASTCSRCWRTAGSRS